ncbi:MULTISPECIES: ABC transporter permease [Pseudomonadati]|uniref:ABC transporter permease n=1 Tax=unclassified Halobacteriovorax TaxID=2639665 RepID=UPI000CCFDA31|nr:ABC transporter permease subunit [Halobacteriovorax sp. DA5]POB12674.1 diguanylate cyclase [Halobacteriovorax sp. DA5]
MEVQNSNVTTMEVFKEFIDHFSDNKGALFGLALVLGFIIIALLAPLIAPHGASEIFPGQLRIPPFWAADGSMQFILGTDDLGRDVLSRLIYGAQISLFVGISIVLISTVVGTMLGLLAGYFGGKTDAVIMRFIDILMAYPSILLAIIVVSVIGPGLMNAVFAVALVSVPSFTRLIRANVLEIKNLQYIQAAKTFGASPMRIMLKEILPNCMATLIVQVTLGLSEGILSTAALGFLGLGVQAPTPEWGIMLSDARPYIQSAPWLVTLPGLCILAVVLGLNLFGDGLRDALDPKLKR